MLYNVFNQFTGLNTKCNTEEEAKLACIQVIQDILNQSPVLVNRISVNENGDEVWTPDTSFAKITLKQI